MKKIDEQIKWYEQNSNNPYNSMVSIELEKISRLYNNYQDHTNEIFVEEMIESFCKIIERQRERIAMLETNNAIPRDPEEVTYNYQDLLGDDEKMQEAFIQYCIAGGRSSYTANDYCSRIKSLWKSFERDFRAGGLDDNLAKSFNEVPWEGDLLNVYENVDYLKEYIEQKINTTNANRNWLNARAALKKFGKFKECVNQE